MSGTPSHPDCATILDMGATVLVVDDHPSWRGMRSLRIAVWIAGALLLGTMVVGAVHTGVLSPAKASVHYGVGLILITIGLVVWARRPDTRTGVLLTAAPFALALNELADVFPSSAVAYTIGLAAFHLDVPIIAQVVLSYPTGRLTTRLDLAFVATCYGFWLAFVLPLLLFFDPRAPHDPSIWVWPSRALPITHVSWRDVTGIRHVFDGILFVLIVLFVALLIRKLMRSTPAGRRVVLPLVVALGLVAVQFAVQVGLFFVGSSTNFWTSTAMFWTETIAGLLFPLALAAGLIWGRGARAAVADLVVELERTPPGAVRDALAGALGDPSLELALWLPERGSFVDSEGRPIELPVADPSRAVTVLGPADAPVAALVHDPALRQQGALLTSAGAAARLALENERLQAALRLQLEELRMSRARLVNAGDNERRRLERNLHDGAQQRLVVLGLALQLARAQLGPESNGADSLLTEATDELRAAVDELRELARGLHPAILTQNGLGAALNTLAARSPVPVRIVGTPEGRLPSPIEAGAYFLVSESLANVAKYARASHVDVGIVHVDGLVRVDVDDDGVGGADPSRGSGLRGLADRVQALDGELLIDSPPGGGTHVHAEIPCA
jgi:signal transduction histidine kinase